MSDTNKHNINIFTIHQTQVVRGDLADTLVHACLFFIFIFIIISIFQTQVERGDMPDTLVHACLFFISPTGHGLKPLDVEFMKKIHDKVLSENVFPNMILFSKVNLIPVIGKADSFTTQELKMFKMKVNIHLQVLLSIP